MSALRSSIAAEDARPPLAAGDVMTRAEFHRRYALHPEIKSAELIEGVVYVASPLRARDHGFQDASVAGWLAGYWANQPGVRCASNSTVVLDADNEVQPDVVLLRESDGSSRLTADGYRDILLGPVWAQNKLDVLNAINKELERRNAYQGMRCESIGLDTLREF